MPDLTGFDVLENESIKPLPFIIFVTAYDHYAIKAFNVHAVDYLLKPYDDERFVQALEHAKEQILLKDASFLHKKMVRILDEYQYQQSDELTAIEVKEKAMTKLINVNDIYWIEAEGNYLKINLENRRHLIRQTMQNIESQLDKTMFIRVHRSILVNQLYIRNVKYKGNNQYVFNLKNEVKFSKIFNISRLELKIMNEPPPFKSSMALFRSNSFAEIHSPDGPLTCMQ